MGKATSVQNKLKLFIENSKFENTILVIILLNAILLGLQTSQAVNQSIGTYLTVIDTICLVIFTLEILLKLFVYKFTFFKTGFNVFDFIIVLTSILSDLSFLSVFRVLRVFRVLKTLKSVRALRMVSGVSKLNIIIKAIGKSITSILWSALLLLIIFYVFAVMGTTLFGADFPEWFGNIGSSFYTLFQVMTLESWSMGISRPVMEVFSWAWIYFVPFVLVSAFVMMNVVVGIVVNTISEATESEKREELKLLAENKDEMLKREVLALKEQVAQIERLIED
ncbi:MAG: ion transporter [Clostridia bacterium]